MVSDSVTRVEVFQQLTRAKSESAAAAAHSCLRDALTRDLKTAVSQRTPSSLSSTAAAPPASPPAAPALTQDKSEESGDSRKRVAVASISGQLARDLLLLTPDANRHRGSRDPDHPSHGATAAPSDHPSAAAGAAGLSSSPAAVTRLTQQEEREGARDAPDAPASVSQRRERLLQELEEFRSDSRCLGVVILGIKSSDPEHLERDILLYFPDQRLLHKVG